MSWLKIDPAFPRHPKLAAMGDDWILAGWLHLCASCYCADYLTDGYVSRKDMAGLTTFEPLSSRTALEIANAMADQPPALQLFERTNGGFLVHDYLDYNPSREEYEALKEARARAGRIGGSRSKPPALHRKPAPKPKRSHVVMYFEEKIGRDATEDECRSIAGWVKRYGADRTSMAIGQAAMQGQPSAMGLITTILKAEAT